jgi:tetratricopeptide (TPR) repeat protein
MNLEEDILIENYLKNTLSESDELDFIKRMSNDSGFKEKVTFEKQLLETLNENNWSFSENNPSNEVKDLEDVFKSDDVRKIKEAISIAHKEYVSNGKSNNKFIYFAAASVAVLFSVYSLFFTVNQSPNELYAEYIKTNELYSNISRGEEALLDGLAPAELNFKKKNYDKALPVFIKELSKDENNASLYLYVTISQIELNQFSEAEETLNVLINSDLIDAEKGYWYKSLLFVKSNQLEKAKKQLEFIIKNSYFKSEEAKELLRKLEN